MTITNKNGYIQFEEEQLKQDKYPNLNRGNNNKNITWAMKFDTPEKRRQLCQDYIAYLKEGMPKEYFAKCTPFTMSRYLKDFPEDFDVEAIELAELEGKQKIIKIGYAGMTGQIENFRHPTWQFITMNMTKWKLKNDVTTDDEKIEAPQIFIPKEKE